MQRLTLTFVAAAAAQTLRVWEFGIPVEIKYIADPSMHSMPSIAVHPNGQWFAAQSLDNQIVIYGREPPAVSRGQLVVCTPDPQAALSAHCCGWACS